MDIDGVLTDGTVLFDEDGREFKRITYRDLDAISSLRRSGYKVGFVTGEGTRLAEFFRQRLQHDYFEIGCQDKLAAVQSWLELEGIAANELCYVGDGASDVRALAFAGLGVCPADGSPDARVNANLILDARGGRGAIEELAIKLLEGAEDNFRSFRL
jgi:YrbI family 3-deoxy-D-manno-octulosonate 8-phosphate phosphatase